MKIVSRVLLQKTAAVERGKEKYCKYSFASFWFLHFPLWAINAERNRSITWAHCQQGTIQSLKANILFYKSTTIKNAREYYTLIFFRATSNASFANDSTHYAARAMHSKHLQAYPTLEWKSNLPLPTASSTHHPENVYILYWACRHRHRRRNAP